MPRKRRITTPTDLEPYLGCAADELLGIDPLAVGWLDRRSDFPTGSVPPEFVEQLLTFCLPEYTVCQTAAARPCPLENHAVEPLEVEGERVELGRGELRAIGEIEIYAAPTLIYHFVTVHHYRPPDEFIAAVVHGPQPNSSEHRALIRTLRSG